MPSKTGGSEKPTETTNRPNPIRARRDLAKHPKKLFMTRKTSSSSNNAPQPKAPACDLFMKDPSLMPSLDLHPVDEKRWLDSVPAQHGAAQGDKRPNRWETILTMRQQLQTQMMSRHTVDCMNLLQEYGVNSVGVTVYMEGNSACEPEAALVIDEPVGYVKKDADTDTDTDTDDLAPEESDYTLTVQPILESGFDYWAITDGGPEICHDLQATTMVYLYIPVWPGSREQEFTMQDQIIWFDGSMVMAKAEIDAVHQDDIIVVNDGMIVPVRVSFWPRVMPPIDLEKSCPAYGADDALAEYHQILIDKPLCPKQSKQSKRMKWTSSDRPLARLATKLGLSLGNHVMEEIESAMKKNRSVVTPSIRN